MSEERWQVTGSAAEIYQRQLVPAIFDAWAPRVLDLAAPATGGRLLDTARGTGVVARLAAGRVGPSGQVVGQDLNPGMLAVASTLPPGRPRPTPPAPPGRPRSPGSRPAPAACRSPTTASSRPDARPMISRASANDSARPGELVALPGVAVPGERGHGHGGDVVGVHERLAKISQRQREPGVPRPGDHPATGGPGGPKDENWLRFHTSSQGSVCLVVRSGRCRSRFQDHDRRR
jgi:ubiE/COQ5 methyltransferase family